MQNRYTFVCLLFLMQLLIPVVAQQEVENLFIKQLTSKQGLQNNNVYSILQDYYGFMWFGTENGLHRYNGLTFTVYEHNQNVKASGTYFLKMCLSKDFLRVILFISIL